MAAVSPAPDTTLDAPAVGRPVTPAFVDAAWLHAHLDEVRVIDTRRGSDFLTGHVAGARSLPLDALLLEDTSPDALVALGRAVQHELAARGVRPDEHLVLIDDADGSAALGAVLCELAGATRVSVAHGAMGDWVRAEHDLAAAHAAHPAVDDAAWATTPLVLQHVAGFDDVLDASSTGRAVVLDTRSQLEHEGIIGSLCCTRRGSVPSSLHLEWTAFFDMSGAPRQPERIREIARHLGFDSDAPLIVSCHSGHRAAIAARLLRGAGYGDTRVSLGSWHEWSARVDLDDAGA